MLSLPIDVVIPEVLAALVKPRHSGSLVLEAPPGAGKTTRVPFAITQAAWCTGQVLVTEPRRIAARLSATRVAEERGLTLGREVGYRVRFDDRATHDTRLVYLTEGLLLRRLLADPRLAGVSAVVFDEVHEQSADLEIALALLTHQQKSQPELRLVAMSATLDAARIAEFWDGAQRLTSAGRTYDVVLEHAARPDDRPLEIQVRSAVRAALDRPGDVLVFLPGAREIRQCEEALGNQFDVEVVPLHGDLPIEAQARAVGGRGARRRVVLSTNVAESSLTIDGVTTVIDSGLARVARHDAWSGIGRLELEEISRARAIQRAGRAGRTQEGHAVRLFTSSNFASRPGQETPELRRSNLSEMLLLLRASGVDESGLALLSELQPNAWLKAEEELNALGALAEGTPNAIGKRMLDFPLPVRLARVLVEGERLGVFDDAALAVALLADRDVLRSTRSFGSESKGRIEAGDSDLEDRVHRYREAEFERFSGSSLRGLELDPAGVRRVELAYKQLRRLGRSTNAASPAVDALTHALFMGFSDRVAERKATGQDLLLMNGQIARLADTSAVLRAPLLLCLSADAPRGKQSTPLVRLAHRIDADQLLDWASTRIEAREEFQWSAEKERVEESSSLTYGRIALDSSVKNATPSPGAGAVLYKIARTKGAASFDPEARLETLAARLLVLTSHAPETFTVLDEALRLQYLGWAQDPLALAEQALALACEGAVQLGELTRLDLAELVEQELPQPVARALRELTPREVILAGGRRLSVHYQTGRAPWIESRLQDFFGMTQTPSLCRGRLPLQIHFLAPNKRAVQVTTDLDGFWERHYPTLRKELMRKYPRHLWPEDGRGARPPEPGKIR